ncbi:Hha/YmoA family nucleoid-associated regulatory protein [Aeromonas rivipollensis]|uniref:Hha/YmoA family nucleoid-associated regulatory protein n=1 Tax=Aeromonas rivipollensis TaxID=948519 RepID=UPI003D1A68D1
MIDIVIRLRRFKNIDALEQVACRMIDKAASVSFQEELKTIAALDHRRAEIASGKRFDVGCVPAFVWAMVE